jgi:hypothetical protein
MGWANDKLGKRAQTKGRMINMRSNLLPIESAEALFFMTTSLKYFC